MPPERHLSDRDQYLLKILSITTVINYQQLKRIYGDKKHYHYRRSRQLQDRGLIILDGKHVRITGSGMKEATGKERVYYPKSSQYDHRVKLAEISMSLTNWEVYSSLEIKRRTSLNDSALINMYIENSGRGYAIYILARNPEASTITRIKNELDDLSFYGIQRAIVFCSYDNNYNSANKFGRFYRDTSLTELLLLPFPDQIKKTDTMVMLKYVNHMKKINAKIRNQFQEYQLSNRSFADFEKENEYITSLVFNDLIKKTQLFNYMQGAVKKEKKKTRILCLESQSKEYSLDFPEVEQTIIHPGKEKTYASNQ